MRNGIEMAWIYRNVSFKGDNFSKNKKIKAILG
jgi:hypothetical protein